MYLLVDSKEILQIQPSLIYILKVKHSDMNGGLCNPGRSAENIKVTQLRSSKTASQAFPIKRMVIE